MALLAESKRKVKYGLDPRNTNWSNDDSKFGQRLMEKMGWEKGKGLGASETGMTEHIKATLKSDTRGLGCSPKDADAWIAHQDDFNDLLKALNSEHGGSDDSKKEEPKTDGSKRYYGRFARGSVQKLRSTEDLDCIFGKRKAGSAPESPATQSNSGSDEESAKTESSHGLQTVVSSSSVQEYFAQKMAQLKARASTTLAPESGDAPGSHSNSTDKRQGLDSRVPPVFGAVGFSYGDEDESSKDGLNASKISFSLGTPEVVDDEEGGDEGGRKRKKKSKKRKSEGIDEAMSDNESMESEKKKKKKKEGGEDDQCEDTVISQDIKKSKKKKRKRSENDKDCESSVVDGGKEEKGTDAIKMEVDSGQRKRKRKSATNTLVKVEVDEPLEDKNVEKKSKKKSKKEVDSLCDEPCLIKEESPVTVTKGKKNKSKKRKDSTSEASHGEQEQSLDAEAMSKDKKNRKSKKSLEVLEDNETVVTDPSADSVEKSKKKSKKTKKSMSEQETTSGDTSTETDEVSEKKSKRKKNKKQKAEDLNKSEVAKEADETSDGNGRPEVEETLSSNKSKKRVSFLLPDDKTDLDNSLASGTDMVTEKKPGKESRKRKSQTEVKEVAVGNDRENSNVPKGKKRKKGGKEKKGNTLAGAFAGSNFVSIPGYAMKM